MTSTIDRFVTSADAPPVATGSEGPGLGATPWWARAWLPIAALVAIGAVFIARTSLVTADGRTFTLFDDAMVSMRFARNLAEGHGLVYNAGQAPVEGYTNFLWTLWMAGLHLLPVPTRFVPGLVSLSGLGLLAVGVVLVRAIARRLAPDAPAVAAVAMWATALYYPLIFWTLRGLEPGLLSVLLEASVLLAWRLRDEPTVRRGAGLALVLVAGVLTRTDFVLLAGAVVVWLAWPGASRDARRAALAAGGAVVVAVAAHTAFAVAYYGEAVPNTYALKIEGIGLGTRLTRGGEGLGALVLAELAVVLVLAAIGVASRRTARGRTALIVAVVVTAAVYSVFVGGDAWEYLQYANRYLTPVVPLLFVVAACGCHAIGEWPARRARLAVLGLGAVALLATVGAASLDPDPHGFNLRNAVNLDLLTRARWIGLAGCLALILVAYLLVAERRSSLVMGALAGVLIMSVGLPAWTAWAQDGGHLVATNKYETRIGLQLGRIADGRPTIAVVAGGTVPYWSTLPAVDLLGKSDATIAEGPSVRAGFVPGHTKWSYPYSICTLRPVLVTQLFEPTEADERLIEGCGYEHIYESFYLRKDQTGFAPEPLSRVVFGTKLP